MFAVKIGAALTATAAIFFLIGYMNGEQSVPRSEKFYQDLIDKCHRHLEVGLDADFGRCIAGKPYNSN